MPFEFCLIQPKFNLAENLMKQEEPYERRKNRS